MMVQQLWVWLLVRQDVEEWGRCIASRSCSRVQRPWTPQCWWQAEGRRGPRMETLLIKRLQVDNNGHIKNSTHDYLLALKARQQDELSVWCSPGSYCKHFHWCLAHPSYWTSLRHLAESKPHFHVTIPLKIHIKTLVRVCSSHLSQVQL